MKRNYVIGTLLAALTIAGSAQLSAQDNGPGNQVVRLIPDGETVYDTINHITWLADANLAAQAVPGTLNFRFGLPLCDISSTEPIELPEPCVNASGSMNYASALAWVKGMNNANYLGHHDWQLPTTWKTDHSCPGTGAQGNSFAFGCSGSALGYLYYKALGREAPNTAVPIPDHKVGPFNNFQPYFYWSQSGGGGLPANIAVFSFNSGSQGGATTGNFMYVLPMIPDKIFATSAASGMGLQVNKGGTMVYDPETIVTWLADANLAATERFGLPPCKTAPDTKPCVARDGSMNFESAMAWVKAMNAYEDPITKFVGYLGQTNWELPPLEASCPLFGCAGDRNPMGNLYYDQLKRPVGKPVVAAPDIAVGPFHHLQPYLYWSCQAKTIQDACQAAGPVAGSEWGFSFGNGFLGTEGLEAEYYVTVYFPGCALSDPMKCLTAP